MICTSYCVWTQISPADGTQTTMLWPANHVGCTVTPLRLCQHFGLMVEQQESWTNSSSLNVAATYQAQVIPARKSRRGTQLIKKMDL